MVNEGIATATDYFHSIPIDIIVLTVSVIAVAAATYYVGKKMSLALLLALYPALILFQALPFVFTTPQAQVAYTRGGLFLIVWFASFFAIRPFFSSSYPVRSSTQLTEAAFFGVTVVGMAIAIAYRANIFPALYAFAPAMVRMFQGDIPFFAWMLVPLVGMMIFIRA